MEQTLLEYKCPSCGGALQFESDLQKMKCPYCDCEFEMEALAVVGSVAMSYDRFDMLLCGISHVPFPTVLRIFKSKFPHVLVLSLIHI